MDWAKFSDGREYSPVSLLTEGFVHLSTFDQITETAEKYFKGKGGLLLLEFSISEQDQNLKWESAPGRKGLFPHYYSAIDVSLVKNISDFTP